MSINVIDGSTVYSGISRISIPHATIALSESDAGSDEVTGITLSSASLSLTVGDIVRLTPTITPSTAGDKSVTWTTSSANIAAVSNGLVTAVGSGTATITATTNDGGYVATCALTVVSATFPYPLQNGKVTFESGGNTDYPCWAKVYDGNTFRLFNGKANGKINVYRILSNTSDITSSANNAASAEPYFSFSAGDNVVWTIESCTAVLGAVGKIQNSFFVLGDMQSGRIDSATYPLVIEKTYSSAYDVTQFYYMTYGSSGTESYWDIKMSLEVNGEKWF